jgi:uncharacterized protein DUF4432
MLQDFPFGNQNNKLGGQGPIMATQSWILTDILTDTYLDTFEMNSQELGGQPGDFSCSKRRLKGGLRDGVDLVEIELATENGPFRVSIVPTRGMGIWRASLGEINLGWKSPVRGGPVHPAFVNTTEGSGIGWLDGFDELLVRCGLENNGGPFSGSGGNIIGGLHGKISNIPAWRVELEIDIAVGEIRLIGQVDEARLFHNQLRLTTTYTFKVGSPKIQITDQVENLSESSTAELELLYHINMGRPFLEPGAKLHIPFEKMAPHNSDAVAGLKDWATYAAPSPGQAEACFFFTPAADPNGNTRIVLQNASATAGFGISFNTKQLPQFIQWKNPAAYSDGYVTGLEPAINFPNPKPFEKSQGRVATLEPKENRTFELALEAIPTADQLSAAVTEVEKLQASKTPKILPNPDPFWSQG